MRSEVARLRGSVDVLASHGTPSQRVASDQETTAQHRIVAEQALSERRWNAVQTLLGDQAVRAGLVGAGGVVVVVVVAVIWFLVTGETRPPIPGVSP